MKIIKYIFLIFVSCNQTTSDTENTLDSTKINNSIYINCISNKDSLLMSTTYNILHNLKNNNILQFINNVNNNYGLIFSPYLYVDTTICEKLSTKEILELNKSNKIITWGVYDGSGDTIKLSFNNYFNKFVYDKDFSIAEISINKLNSISNSTNNIKEVFPNCDFVECYLNGFDEKYDGLDWESLIFVFKTDKNKAFLVAIIHSQWTA